MPKRPENLIEKQPPAFSRFFTMIGNLIMRKPQDEQQAADPVVKTADVLTSSVTPLAPAKRTPLKTQRYQALGDRDGEYERTNQQPLPKLRSNDEASGSEADDEKSEYKNKKAPFLATASPADIAQHMAEVSTAQDPTDSMGRDADEELESDDDAIVSVRSTRSSQIGTQTDSKDSRRSSTASTASLLGASTAAGSEGKEPDKGKEPADEASASVEIANEVQAPAEPADKNMASETDYDERIKRFSAFIKNTLGLSEHIHAHIADIAEHEIVFKKPNDPTGFIDFAIQDKLQPKKGTTPEKGETPDYYNARMTKIRTTLEQNTDILQAITMFAQKPTQPQNPLLIASNSKQRENLIKSLTSFTAKSYVTLVDIANHLAKGPSNPRPNLLNDETPQPSPELVKKIKAFLRLKAVKHLQANPKLIVPEQKKHNKMKMFATALITAAVVCAGFTLPPLVASLAPIMHALLPAISAYIHSQYLAIVSAMPAWEVLTTGGVLGALGTGILYKGITSIKSFFNKPKSTKEERKPLLAKEKKEKKKKAVASPQAKQKAAPQPEPSATADEPLPVLPPQAVTAARAAAAQGFAAAQKKRAAQTTAATTSDDNAFQYQPSGSESRPPSPRLGAG